MGEDDYEKDVFLVEYSLEYYNIYLCTHLAHMTSSRILLRTTTVTVGNANVIVHFVVSRPI